MIVCQRCGNREPDDSKFCGECSAFLEFEGTRVESEPEPAASPAATPEVTAGVEQPDEAVAHSAPALKVKRKVGPGEMACPAPACEAGNDPKRKFCKVCGAELNPAQPVAEPRLPWWKRAWRRLFRARTFRAGERERRVNWRRFKIRKRWIALALVLILGYSYQTQLRDLGGRAVNEVRDRISDQVPITPDEISASGSRGGNGPSRLIDRDLEKFWAAGDPADAWVQARLPRPVRLLSIIITGGVSHDATKFQEQGRPHEVDVILTSADGSAASVRIVVADQAGPQTFAVKGDQVVTVRLVFLSAHGLEQSRFLAVAEIEFFHRK